MLTAMQSVHKKINKIMFYVSHWIVATRLVCKYFRIVLSHGSKAKNLKYTIIHETISTKLI